MSQQIPIIKTIFSSIKFKLQSQICKARRRVVMNKNNKCNQSRLGAKVHMIGISHFLYFAILINLFQLSCPVQAGRLQEFFQNLVGNSVGLSNVLTSALLSSSSHINNNNNHYHQQQQATIASSSANSNPQSDAESINNGILTPLTTSFAINNNNDNNQLITQRTSSFVGAGKNQPTFNHDNDNFFASGDLETAATMSNSQKRYTRPNMINSFGDSDINSIRHESSRSLPVHSDQTVIMSPMIPAISPYSSYNPF